MIFPQICNDTFELRREIDSLRSHLKSERDARSKLEEELRQMSNRLVAKPLSKWHEDLGPALWWRFPIQEPPYSGTPLDTHWPGYHTHWTPIPMPEAGEDEELEGEWSADGRR